MQDATQIQNVARSVGGAAFTYEAAIPSVDDGGATFFASSRKFVELEMEGIVDSPLRLTENEAARFIAILTAALADLRAGRGTSYAGAGEVQ